MSTDLAKPTTGTSTAVTRRILGVPPATTLADAFRLCDPFTPLDAELDTAIHADLTKIRGGDRIAKVVRSIERSGGNPTLHFLSGHLGCGKTTELRRMKRRLEQPLGGAPSAIVLFLDADEMLNRHDVELEDILVALWSLLYKHSSKAAAKVLAPLWTKQIMTTLAGLLMNLPDAIPDAMSKVLGEVRLPGLDQRRRVRAALGSVLPVLIEGLNKAFDAIRRDSPDDSSGEFVVLIDNLEKLSQGQRDAVERLYLERMGALKELQAHLVITVPLYLCYASSGASLIGRYGGETVILPMIEVRRRIAAGGGDNPAGLKAMVDLLQKRVRFDPLFEEGVTAAEHIARASGGCIRHALRIIQSAVNEHDSAPVSKNSVERAVGTVQADFERALPEPYVPVLKQIAQTNRFPDDCTEDTKRDLLLNLYVLEYQNGSPEPWYAVHPLVERCRKYREHA